MRLENIVSDSFSDYIPIMNHCFSTLTFHFTSKMALIRFNDGVLIPVSKIIGEEVIPVTSRSGEPLPGIVTHWSYRFHPWYSTEVMAIHFYVPSTGKRTWRYPLNLRLAHNNGRYDRFRMCGRLTPCIWKSRGGTFSEEWRYNCFWTDWMIRLESYWEVNYCKILTLVIIQFRSLLHLQT